MVRWSGRVMEKMNNMQITKIKNGVVIDHIKAGL
jgi:aspartate carbamoyltransferase regulatory subunit